MIEKTLAIIKPDAVAAQNEGKIIDLIKQHGFTILAEKRMQLTQEEAEAFYAVHKERPFFGELVEFMISGPVVVMALEKENAIADWRKLMGDTDPAKADEGTVRKLFGSNIGENATHGSDSPETAAHEVRFFFPNL
jgi:nucleoside-diphosphate kinase